MDTLDLIGAEAAPLEAEQQAAIDAIENPPAPEPLIDPSYGWAQIPAVLGGMLGMALPELQGVYTEDACMKWGVAMHMVATKHGWECGETMARFGPEIALAVASFPLVVPVVQVVKARRAEAEAERERRSRGLVEDKAGALPDPIAAPAP